MDNKSVNIKVFSCNANHVLAERITGVLGIKLGDSKVSTFSDGEISVKINETVRNADVFIIQPTSWPVNDNLMELLIMIDAMSRASAGRITAVIPYYGYARQDRKADPRDPISAKLVADLITTAGANRVVTMDLHCPQIQGFFNIPVDHLTSIPILADYYKDKLTDMRDVIVVSPDFGSVSRARAIAEILDIPLAIIDKRRPKPNVSEVMNIVGEVSGKTAILVDDEIDTAGSITQAAAALKQRGAVEILACCTHAVLSGPAVKRLEESEISELVLLDTIPLPECKKLDKMKVISVASLFADAMYRIHEGLSVSTLFNKF